MKLVELPPSVRTRRAIIYVRQSTVAQVLDNVESQKRQYDLGAVAHAYGFRDIVTIDEDQGRSASGTTERPGFQALVAQICEGVVGAVFCLEASRLARNGRDWHHLLELCGLVGARVVDPDGVYDPALPNDRLLLGLKGTMSEFELTVLRRRLIEALQSKARRGELRLAVPVGYLWSKDTGLDIDPDRRIQEAIRTIFRLFAQLGSARQVLLQMHHDGLCFPRPSDAKRSKDLVWRAPSYRNVIAVLQNPFYAGAYVYGKSGHRTKLIDGHLRTTYGHPRPKQDWDVVLRDHHAVYISWEEHERIQEQLGRNAFRKAAGEAKSGRGGRALLAGLLRCGRCGRMLQIVYSGRVGLARYSCKLGHVMHGLAPCLSFGARRPDEAIATVLLEAVQPLAIDAALLAEQNAAHEMSERHRALELERQQLEYEMRLAARRYEAVDPDNRLVAAELEGKWNAALMRLRECEARLAAKSSVAGPATDREALLSLARDLPAVWNSKTTDMKMKQRLVRALIEEIVVNMEEATREVVLVVHWQGGVHSELRVRKPASGEHRMRACKEADEVIREMATRWPAEHIAATLNRMGLKTGQGLSWNESRVDSYRKTAGITAYDSSVKDGRWLTMVEAAKKLGVTSHVIRKLIKDGVLPARQVMEDAPWQIAAADLDLPSVKEALRTRRVLRRPCRDREASQTLRIPGT